MSNAIDDLEAAGKAVKDGVKHVGEAIKKELGGKPEAEPTTTTPDGCGPMGCDEPAQA